MHQRIRQQFKFVLDGTQSGQGHLPYTGLAKKALSQTTAVKSQGSQPQSPSLSPTKCCHEMFSATVGFLTSTQNWQYWHHYQLFISVYLQFPSLIAPNVKLDVSGFKGIMFQGCRFPWSSSFSIAQLKQSWQYWHSCIAESL